jgi:hypothetical protein
MSALVRGDPLTARCHECGVHFSVESTEPGTGDALDYKLIGGFEDFRLWAAGEGWGILR